MNMLQAVVDITREIANSPPSPPVGPTALSNARVARHSSGGSHRMDNSVSSGLTLRSSEWSDAICSRP